MTYLIGCDEEPKCKTNKIIEVGFRNYYHYNNHNFSRWNTELSETIKRLLPLDLANFPWHCQTWVSVGGNHQRKI